MSDAGKVHAEIGKGVGYGVAVVIGLAFVGLAAAFVFGAFSDGTVERRGQTAQQEATVGDAAWRLAQYDRFFTQCQAIVTVEEQIALARGSGTADPGDAFFDRRELRALENQRLELVGRYNADAARTETAGAFRDAGLPASIDPAGRDPVRTMRARVAAAALLVSVGVLAGCSDPTQQQIDAATSQGNINRLVAGQPVEAGRYSPTREQINNWNRVWQSAPGKLAYTYLFVGGEPIGYYVLVGPPVSYAASATMPVSQACSSSACAVLPNAGQDGAFYGAGTGQFQFYGKDATTGRQLEWGGPTMSYLLSDRPLRLDVPPLGDTVIEEGER